MPRKTLERDQRFRAAELAAYAHFGGNPQERFVTCRGADGSTDVRVMTFEPDATGHPVVLLHGIASMNVVAAPLLPFLSGRPVHAIDWPGHGLSERCIAPAGTEFRMHAVSILASVIDRLGLAQVDLVGHSLGAQIALYAAHDRADLVQRLVLLGAPGAAFAGTKPVPVMKILAVPKLGTLVLSLPMPKRAFVRNTEGILGKGTLDDLPDELIDAAHLIAGRRANAASIASCFRALLHRGSVRPGVNLTPDELGRIQQPTVMIWGDDDVFLTPKDGAASVASLPHAELVAVPCAGHAPWLQALEPVGAAIARHLHTSEA